MSRPKGWKNDDFFVEDVSYSFDKDTEEALNIATPINSRLRKRNRNSFSTSRLPCDKPLGPLAEAINRQDNVIGRYQSRVQNNQSSTDEGVHVQHQPTPSHQKFTTTLESCSTKNILKSTFSSTLKGLKKKVMTYTDRAANTPKISYSRVKLQRKKNDTDLVDLCDESSSSKDVTPTEPLKSPKLHRRHADNLETKPPMTCRGSFVSDSSACGRNRRTNDLTKGQFHSTISPSVVSDSMKGNICHSLNDDEDDDDDLSSGVLAIISKERFKPKTQDILSILTRSLPPANAPTLTTKCIKVTNVQKERNLLFTKANGMISHPCRRRTPKGIPINPGSSIGRGQLNVARKEWIGNKEGIQIGDPLMDSSSEDDSPARALTSRAIKTESNTDENQQVPEAVRKTRTLKFDVSTLSIGTRFVSSNCKFTVCASIDELSLSYSLLGTKMEHKITFEDIEELKFSRRDTRKKIDVAVNTNILTMKIKPSESNKLIDLSVKNPVFTQKKVSTNVVIAFRDDEVFEKAMVQLRQISFFGAFFDNNSNRLKGNEVDKFATSLLKKTRTIDIGHGDGTISSRKSPRRHEKHSEKGNDILFVFPFGAEIDKIDAAGEDLHEASIGCGLFSGESVLAFQANSCTGDDDETSDESGNTTSRGHYLTIRQVDRDRLTVGEFLNDTLIDFWMQWMWRKENRTESVVHVFTSHFYTTLAEGGPKSVESWTSKKNIDIFQKKMIFIPINKSLHWSLCVVMNPRDIVSMFDKPQENGGDDPFPCILFLDSLKAHKKHVVAKQIHSWLNAEWERLGKAVSSKDLESMENPFTMITMKVIAPRIPRQNNSWDCGVFVCRYAYGLFKNRHHRYTRHDGETHFETLIANSDEFAFKMRDIARMRIEFGTLVDRLSDLYKCWKIDECQKANEVSDMEHLRVRVKEVSEGGVSFV